MKVGTSCSEHDISESHMQGYGRKQRGLIAYKSLGITYPGIEKMQKIAIVPGCWHDDVCMFHSPQFQTAWTYQASHSRVA